MTEPLTALIARLRELADPLKACRFEITGADIWYTDQDQQTGEPVQVHVASGEAQFITAATEAVNALPALLSAIEAQAAEVARYREALEAAHDIFGQVASRVERENRYIDDENIDPAWKAISSLAWEGHQIIRAALATDPHEK